MTNKELGREYLDKAQKIKEKIEYLENDLQKKAHFTAACDKIELNRRIRILFEMYIDLRSTGERLMGIRKENRIKSRSVLLSDKLGS